MQLYSIAALAILDITFRLLHEHFQNLTMWIGLNKDSWHWMWIHDDVVNPTGNEQPIIDNWHPSANLSDSQSNCAVITTDHKFVNLPCYSLEYSLCEKTI